MSTLNFNKQHISIFTIWLFSISAIIGIYLGYVSWFIPKTPLNLTIGAVLLFWNLPIDSLRKITVWLFAFAVGMIMEILGVQTGEIFGTYYYGENLGTKLMGVPYLIGVNWAVLSFITAALASRLTKNFWLAVVIGSSLMVGLDFFMEPLASLFDFWHFEGGIIPVQNYVAWFVIALLLHFIIQKNIDFHQSNFSIHLFLTQLVFFGSCCLMLL